MGEVTIGIVKKRLTDEDILSEIQSYIDPKAFMLYRVDGILSKIKFRSKSGEVRILSVQEYSEEFNDDEEFSCLNKGDEYTFLSLGCTKSSPNIMREVVSLYSGWVKDNDCDDKDFEFVEKRDNK